MLFMEDYKVEIDSDASRRLENISFSYDTFSFFGVEFKVACDSSDFRDQYRNTYKHQRAVSQRHSTPTFRIVSQHIDRPTVFVSNLDSVDLPAVFTQGSNRHRFRLTPVGTDGLWFEVRDAFLENAPVMFVRQASCVIQDVERWRAYAESIVFNTIISLIPDHFLVHAGVVSWQNSGMILCGEANKGKTTLTLGLVQRGFKFLSDEVAFIDVIEKTVRPFPRALGLRENTVRMFSDAAGSAPMQPTKSLSGDDKWLVDIDNMFPGRIGKTSAVEYLFFLDGFSERTELTPMTSSDALMSCLRFAHTAEADPFKSMLLVADIIGRAKAFRLVSGPPGQTTDSIHALVSS